MSKFHVFLPWLGGAPRGLLYALYVTLREALLLTALVFEHQWCVQVRQQRHHLLPHQLLPARGAVQEAVQGGVHVQVLNLSLDLMLPLALSIIIRITIFQHFNQAENQSKINLISAQFHPWPSLSNGNCYRFTMPPWISLFDLHGVVDIGGCYHPESKSSQQSNIENWFELDSNKGSNFCAFHFTNRDKCWTLIWLRVSFIQGVHEKE